MRVCKIAGINVDPEVVFVGSVGFNTRPSPRYALDYVVVIDGDDAVARFDEYYGDFIDRESADDEVVVGTASYYEELRRVGYPSLALMIDRWPKLLSVVLRVGLPSEFLGYCFKARPEDYESTEYTIQTLDSVDVLQGKIICSGFAFKGARS